MAERTTTGYHYFADSGDGCRGEMRRSSWGAILAGVAFAIVVSLLLNILGMAIGLAIVDPQAGGDQAQALGIGGLIWWLVASIIALFCGGWVAGRLAGVPRRLDGAVHGAITWAVTTIVTIYLIGSAVGGIIGGTFSILGQTAEVAGQAAGPVAAEEGVPEPDSAEVEEGLSRVEGAAEEAGRRLRESGEEIADISASAAFSIFVMLLLTGAAGVLGGLVGAPMFLILEERRQEKREDIRKEHEQARERDRERQRDRESGRDNLGGSV